MYPHSRAGLCMIAQLCPKISQFIELIKFDIASENDRNVSAGLFSISEDRRKYKSQFADKTYDLRSNSTSIKISSIRIFVCMMLFLFLNINASFYLLIRLTMPIYHWYWYHREF